MATDGGIGTSATNKVGGMGNYTYIGGYTQGKHALQTTTGDTHTVYDSDNSTMDMHISQIHSSGNPTKVWIFPGNSSVKNYFNELHHFKDGKHLVVTGSFDSKLTLPNGDVLANHEAKGDKSARACPLGLSRARSRKCTHTRTRAHTHAFAHTPCCLSLIHI